jgi:hypothetical protein
MMLGLDIEGNDGMRHFSGDLSENGEEYEKPVHPLVLFQEFFCLSRGYFPKVLHSKT